LSAAIDSGVGAARGLGVDFCKEEGRGGGKGNEKAEVKRGKRGVYVRGKWQRLRSRADRAWRATGRGHCWHCWQRRHRQGYVCQPS
jgi:hypothetical protein